MPDPNLLRVSVFITIIAVMTGVLVLSFYGETILQPRSLLFKRSPAASGLHALTMGALYSAVLMLVQRPLFAGAVVVVIFSLLVVVSNAKYRTLREPLVFSDIVMFSQAFRHPRLYLPFLGWASLIAVPGVTTVLVVAGLYYEPMMPLSYGSIAGLLAFLLFSVVVIHRLALTFHFSLEPVSDVQQFGLLATLLGYAVQANTTKHQQHVDAVLQTAIMAKPVATGSGADVVVIQSESFFDARRMGAAIQPDILSHFDQLCEEAEFAGCLTVPAWGANTLRTEFSFLTGIAVKQLGFYQFYPYYYLQQWEALDSLARYYREQGYFCVCIHPHAATFFNRNAVFPKMGFDQFIDIHDFNPCQRAGPYIADEAVAQKILELMAEQEHPIFIFAITMENHGPFHLETATPEDCEQLYTEPPPEQHNDLTVYLRHLRNADRMFAGLREAFIRRNKETVLCVYGDHVPSLPDSYRHFAHESAQTDYVVWHSNSRLSPPVEAVFAIEELAGCVIGITSRSRFNPISGR